MNTLINKSKNLIKMALVSSLLISVANAYAADPVKVETKSSKSAKVVNVTASMHGNSLSISGKLKRQPGGHIVIPGMVKIELLDANNKVVKTTTTNYRRHSHHINKDYKFSTRVPVESHDVNMVRVTHEMNQMH